MLQETLQNSESMTRATWWLTYATGGLVFTAVVGMAFTLWQLTVDRNWKRGESLARFRELFEGEVFSRIRRTLASSRLLQMKSGVQMTYANAPASAWRMLDFCEAICREVDQGRLSLEDVWSEYSEWIIAYESDFKELIEQERRTRNDQTYYSSIASVRRKLSAYCIKRKVTELVFTRNDLQGFYEVELESTTGTVDSSLGVSNA